MRKDKPYILVVDDVAEVIDALEDQLVTHLGKAFSVEKASSAEEALEVVDDILARGRELAVVVSDVLMPGIKGDELLIRIKARSPRTLTLMLTGEPGVTANITNAINHAGLYRYLSKPWEIHDMQLTIEEAARSFVHRATIEEQNRTLKAITEAAQAIARLRELQAITRSLLPVIVEYSAAERAVLVLSAVPPAQVVAEVRRAGELSFDSRPLADAPDLPTALIQQVIDSGELVHLDQAPSLAAQYPALAQLQSVVVLPLQNVGRSVGALYLEHRTLPGAFSASRVEALGLLAAQAAIAIDNAFVNENLESVILDRTQELLAVSSHKDEMVRIVSHDIRSPLIGISSLAGLLAADDATQTTDEVKKYAQMIEGSTTTVLKLVSDVLDLAKLQSGTILLSRQPADLKAVCERTVKTFEPLYLTKHIRLDADLKEGLVAEVDENKLVQALGNLLSNAAKFTNPGGEVSLLLDRVMEGGAIYARIQVIDRGIGIPAEALARVFERFGVRQRLGTAGEKGTGLGLSIVRELIQLHGGTVAAQSQLGVGTTFTILLPL